MKTTHVFAKGADRTVRLPTQEPTPEFGNDPAAHAGVRQAAGRQDRRQEPPDPPAPPPEEGFQFPLPCANQPYLARQPARGMCVCVFVRVCVRVRVRVCLCEL